MVESTPRASLGDGVPDQSAGFPTGSFRSTATEYVESVVSATEYGSVTTFVSTLPVEGAKTVTRYRYGAFFHDRGPLTDHEPSSLRRMGIVDDPTIRSTSCAVGAHSVNVGAPSCQVTPYARPAAPPYRSSSTPGICTPVASSSRPTSSYWASPSWPVSIFR